MVFRRVLEMSISREEFLRLLAAVGPFEVDGCLMRSSGPGAAWTVRLAPLEAGRIGGLAIPRHSVEIALEAASDAEREAFVERFTRAFMRGGG